MDIKKFTDTAGCRVFECGPGWGGRYGFTSEDAPNVHTCGFKTKTAARLRWMEETYGPKATQAILELLKCRT